MDPASTFLISVADTDQNILNTSQIGHFLLYNTVFSFHIAQIASKFGRIVALG